jgi:hypothetical protein
MNSLREIKASRLLNDESFTYMFCSDEKLTVLQGGTNSNILWDYDFGGFEQPYNDYKVEVLNCVHNGFVLASNVYLYFIAEGLADSGNFIRKKLTNRQAVLSILPVSAIGDAYAQTDGSSGITFNIKNTRVKRRIRFFILKPDFDPVVDTTDINTSSGITRWVLVLKLTPMVDY